jgi:hypothetical protein
MSVETYIKRVLWVAKCPKCGDSVEKDSKPPRERFCNDCKVWIPYKEQSYIGPEFKKG